MPKPGTHSRPKRTGPFSLPTGKGREQRSGGDWCGFRLPSGAVAQPGHASDPRGAAEEAAVQGLLRQLKVKSVNNVSFLIEVSANPFSHSINDIIMKIYNTW